MERALDSSTVLCASNNSSLFAVPPPSLSFCVYLTPKPSEYPFYLRHAMAKLRQTHMKGQLFRIAWLPISRPLSLPRRLQVVSLALSAALHDCQAQHGELLQPAACSLLLLLLFSFEAPRRLLSSVCVGWPDASLMQHTHSPTRFE